MLLNKSLEAVNVTSPLIAEDDIVISIVDKPEGTLNDHERELLPYVVEDAIEYLNELEERG